MKITLDKIFTVYKEYFAKLAVVLDLQPYIMKKTSQLDNLTVFREEFKRNSNLSTLTFYREKVKLFLFLNKL